MKTPKVEGNSDDGVFGNRPAMFADQMRMQMRVLYILDMHPSHANKATMALIWKGIKTKKDFNNYPII